MTSGKNKYKIISQLSPRNFNMAEIRAEKQYLEYEKKAKSQKLTKRELTNSQK
jgi:hypothetical protein